MTIQSGDLSVRVSSTDIMFAAGVPDSIGRIAAETPQTIAVSVDGRETSYAALESASRAIAARLDKRGLGGAVLIAVCLPRSAALVEAVLGIWSTGAAYLALDPAWPDNRLRAIIADAGCAALICDEETAERMLAPADAPVLLIGEQDPDADRSAPVPVRADVLAYVVYTSGSTGAPKGIEITHGNLASLVAWHRDAFGLGAADRVAHIAGLGFDASVWEMWPALCAGATVLPAPEAARTSATLLRDWLVASRITVAFVPTVLAEQLVALEWPAATALRVLLTGGDRLHVFPPAGLPFALVNNYGPSECTVVATSGTVPAARADKGLPDIGWPIAGTYIRLLDPDGEPVADGQPGEIHIGGAGVGRGYRGRPDLTAERFLTDRSGATMFRTGDVGIRQPDGAIAFVGRLDDQVQVRGHRVEPAEIAATISRHPAVATATVVAEDGLVAYLVLGEGAAPSAAEMHEFLAGHLPEAMIPEAFLLLEALPLTANGKLDRAALPPAADCARLAEAAFGAPTTPVEERLVAILAEVIRDRAIGIDDNFFMIGGHSLLGAQLVLRAGDAFGLDLTLRDLFEAPTVRLLGARIEAKVFELVAAMSDEDILARAAE
jgi:amino acid adenylation domain-containing protein